MRWLMVKIKKEERILCLGSPSLFLLFLSSISPLRFIHLISSYPLDLEATNLPLDLMPSQSPTSAIHSATSSSSTSTSNPSTSSNSNPTQNRSGHLQPLSPESSSSPSTSTSSSSALLTTHPNDWSSTIVTQFLETLNLHTAYSSSFNENDITGDALVLLDQESLRDMGVESVGHRLQLLGAIYRLKERWGIQFEEGDWVPNCEFILD